MVGVESTRKGNGAKRRRRSLEKENISPENTENTKITKFENWTK